MTTIAIINQKGGTGKTTTAVNLAAGLARCGHRTLLVDLDPQAHATYGLGIDLEDPARENTPTVANILREENGLLEDIILDTQEPNLKLVPSDITLARAATLLHQRNFREHILSRALKTVVDKFEYVILDCQPSLDVLSINALVAADKILVPTQLAGHSLRGLADLLTTIQTIKGTNNGFDWRVVLTMVTGQAENRQERAWKLLEPIKDRIMQTRIRKNEAIERSQLEPEDPGGLEITPIIMQSKWSKGAKDYRDLVNEILSTWA